MKINKIILTITISLFGLAAYALPPSGIGGPGTGGEGDPDAGVPIDGGISLLVAAGAALGGAKLFKKKKEA